MDTQGLSLDEWRRAYDAEQARLQRELDRIEELRAWLRGEKPANAEGQQEEQP